jgi:hypothetical protein
MLPVTVASATKHQSVIILDVTDNDFNNMQVQQGQTLM